MITDQTFFGLNFQQFADINTVGIFLLILLSLSLLFVLRLKNSNNVFFQKNTFASVFNYVYINRLLFLILLIAVIGANIYERVYGDLPCEFCWYQRILIYPMLILSLCESFLNTRVVHKFIFVFAFLNILVSSYHYYFHFQRYVLDNILQMPCTTNALVPSCAEAGVISFGFVTMPLLSGFMSLSVLIIVYVMSKLQK